MTPETRNALTTAIAAAIRNDLHAPVPVPPEVMAIHVAEALAAARMVLVPATVTRVDIVDSRSRRAGEHWADSWDVHVQDEGRTLKLFANGGGGGAKAERDSHLAQFIATARPGPLPFGTCGCGSTSCAVLTPEHECWCALCNPGAWWMITCGRCGSKRCPKAMAHYQPCAAVVVGQPTEQPEQK